MTTKFWSLYSDLILLYTESAFLSAKVSAKCSGVSWVMDSSASDVVTVKEKPACSNSSFLRGDDEAKITGISLLNFDETNSKNISI
jgi:hypothetical protein